MASLDERLFLYTETVMERYDPKTIEPKWQQVWETERVFETPNPPPGEAAEEPHWYQLEMLPYASGTLHMGHVLNYTMGDVATHIRRRKGWKVLRPTGRERRDQRGWPSARDHRAQYRRDQEADEAPGLGDRLAA
jgi:valyl-tRNA synthetase